MNIYEHDKYPWLTAEKRVIRKAIDNKKYVLGICLGAQLVADVLGAKVAKNAHKEIGWFPVVQKKAIRAIRPFDALPAEYMAFHWHGDTFGIPKGAEPQGSTEGCANQGFLSRENVIGLQYHIEATRESVGALIDNCASELVPEPYVHAAGRIRRDTTTCCENANGLMEKLLDRWIL
jgi:GMP synthase (glutamine-hydrolysing)